MAELTKPISAEVIVQGVRPKLIDIKKQETPEFTGELVPTR